MEHTDDYVTEGCCGQDEYDEEQMFLDVVIRREPELFLLDTYLRELFRK